MTEKHLPPLDLTGPASQVADRWRKWKRAFEYYAEGKGIDNVRKKTSQLLHFAGMEVQDIFEDLQDPGPVPAEGDNAYKVAIGKLEEEEENIPYERHVFRQLSLQEGETADQFMVRLRKQARHCNFGTSLNDNLRDQLIEKLTDFELKRKLLEQRNITLEEALDKVVGGTVASWLARSTPERALRVRALAGGIVLCSWARHLTLTVPLSTQVYKWVPANLMLGGNPAMD